MTMSTADRPRSRPRAALLVALALVAAAAVPVMAKADWEHPDRTITVVDTDGGSLRPLDTVSVHLGGFPANSPVDLAICARAWFDAMGGGQHSSDVCSPATSVSVGPDGTLDADYLIPDMRLVGSVFPACPVRNFGDFRSDCALVAFTGTPPTASVAADLAFTGAGAGSISGLVVDAHTSLPRDTKVSLCSLDGFECTTGHAAAGSFSFGNLPPGDYSLGSVVEWTADEPDHIANTIGFSLDDGERLEGLTLPVASADRTDGPIGGPGVSISISPDSPNYDATVVVSGTGFTPGAEVRGGMCASTFASIGPDGLAVGCESTATTAAADGTAQVSIPFDPATRFRSEYWWDPACTPSACSAFLHETAPDGAGAWRGFSFVAPVGAASISGAARLGDGAPLGSSTSVSICGVLGCQSFTPDIESGVGSELAFEATGLIDGRYTVRGTTYLGDEDVVNEVEVTIEDQRSVTDVDLVLDANAAAGSVVGVVTDVDGDPISGVAMTLCKVDDLFGCGFGVGKQTTTADDGTYRFSRIGDGTHRVLARLFNVGGGSVEASTLVSVVDGGVATADLVLGIDMGTGAISGTLQELTGLPKVGNVIACRYEAASDCRSVSTGDDGAFRLDRLPDGTWSVQGYADGVWSTSSTVEVDGGDETGGVLVTVPLVTNGGHVTGRVVDQGGDVVPHPRVVLCAVDNPEEGCSWLSDYSSTSSEDGTFSRPDLPDGTYQVMAYGLNFSGAAVRTVQVVDGAPLDMGDVVLPVDFGDGSISGTTTDQNGVGVLAWPSACIDVGCFDATSGEGGAYTIENLPDATYTVSAYFEGHFLSEDGVEVSGGGDVTDVDFVFPVTTGGIAGTVVDEHGSPIDGTSSPYVWACNTMTFTCRSGEVGANGEFVIGGLEDGLYTVTALSSLGRASTSAFVQNRTLTTGVVIQYDTLDPVPPGVTIGHVSGDEGSNTGGPIYRGVDTPISVTACAGGSGSWAIDFPGEDGDANGPLIESPAGVYRGAVPPSEARAGEGQLTIEVLCPQGADFEVTIDVYIDPSGFVRDLDGNGIEGATVTLWRSESADGPFDVVPDGSTVMSPSNRTNPDTTEANGHFGWDVTAGYYKVTAEKDGCRSPDDPSQTVVETQVYEIPPPVTDIDLRLDCSEAPADVLAPVLSLSADPEPNDVGWNNVPVTLRLTAADEDGGSGLAGLVLGDRSSEGSALELFLDEDGEHEVVYSATDRAGNTATAVRTVRIDRGVPSVSGSGALAGRVVRTGEDALAEYECTDDLSGIASCDGPVRPGGALDTSTPGIHALTITAVDVAGNRSEQVLSYEVTGEQGPSARMRLEAKGILGRYAVDQSVPMDSFTLKAGPDGQLERLEGRARVVGTASEQLDVRADVSRFLWWNYGQISVKNVTSGDAAVGVLLFSPVVRVSERLDHRSVVVRGEGVLAVGQRVGATRVRLELEQ